MQITGDATYAHPDEAVRHYFRLLESVDSIASASGPKVAAGDRCRHCGKGPSTKRSRDSVSKPDPGMRNHWKHVCVACEKPWEPIPWYEVEHPALRPHGPVTARPCGAHHFVRNPQQIESLEDWLLLKRLVVDRANLWQWRVYGVAWVGLAIGTRGAQNQHVPAIERRTEVGRYAAKQWRSIPKHHTTEWGVRRIVSEGRLALYHRLRDAGLMARGVKW